MIQISLNLPDKLFHTFLKVTGIAFLYKYQQLSLLFKKKENAETLNLSRNFNQLLLFQFFKELCWGFFNFM